jgi:hypothetical protein
MPYSCFYMTNDMPNKQIGRFITFMREHADRSARGMSHKWTLHWHHDRIGIVFDLRDDCRFFQRTYSDAFKEVFAYQSDNEANASAGGWPGADKAKALADLRARLGR